jgi:uncharacterized Fe-S cluster-containing MiaB family protein
MQITKGQLKQIIAEEMENIKNEADELETLIEGYSAAYEADDEFVSKEALIDFLEVLQEQKIPKVAFEAFMSNLPENIVTPLLKEVVED